LRYGSAYGKIGGMKLSNPFVLTGYHGPEYFCDRIAETKKLCTAIRNESNVTLLSPRRYGKTGLIWNSFNELSKNKEFETIYLDIFGTQNLADFTKSFANAVFGRLDTPFEKMSDAAKRLIQGLRPTLSYDSTTGSPSLSFDISQNQAERTLSEVFAYLASHNNRTVIAIDEFQQIRNYPEKGVEAILRSHIQFAKTRFIFAGSKQHLMRDIFTSPKRPFYQSTLMLPLDTIPAEPYYEFAAKFFTQAGLSLDRTVFDALYSRFNGITWYVQAILWDLYASREKITQESQVENAIKERVMANEYDRQMILELLPDGARRLVKAIACEGIVKSPQGGNFMSKYGLRAASSVKTSLQMLLENEILYHDKDGYVVYDRFFTEYLRSQSM
jgi:hypothetical protein